MFSNITQNYKNHLWLSERAILATKNIDVEELKFKIQCEIVGELMAILASKIHKLCLCAGQQNN